jgi:hypothetical protein
VTLSNGQTLRADYIFACVGGARYSDLAARSECLRHAVEPATGKVRTDECLRVALRDEAADTLSGGSRAGIPTGPAATVFALGDAAAHPSREPDVAHTAEKQAICVAASILAIAQQQRQQQRQQSALGAGSLAAASAVAPLPPPACVPYPRGLTGVASSPLIYAVSLGPYEALLAFNGITLTGAFGARRMAALAKFLIERTKTWQLGNVAAAVWFWLLADEAAVAMHVLTVWADRLGAWLALRLQLPALNSKLA